jgi:YD repeat-containing protein
MTLLLPLKYDKQNNIIEEKSTDSKGLFNTTQTYDKYHNPITIKRTLLTKIKHSIIMNMIIKINS